MRKTLRLAMLRAWARLQGPSFPPVAERQRLRLLILRPDHLGDMLFVTPALRALRKALPSAHIACLVGPWAAEVMARNPHVDEVLPCPFPWFSRRAKESPWAPYRLLLREAARLKEKRFDIALNLRFDFWWGAALAYFAAIPQRVAYNIPECRPFLNWALPYAPDRHEVLQNLALIEGWLGQSLSDGAGPLEFPLTSKEISFAEALLAGQEGPWVALHPGAGAPVKRWRPEAFAQLGDALADKYGVQVVVTGSAEERDLVEGVRGQMRRPAIPLVGATLGQLGAVFRRCSLAVGVDSGAMHLAVAVETPTVHLYGPVSAQAFGPWGDAKRHRVVTGDLPCIPCDRLDYQTKELPQHPCISDIPVEQVLVKAEALLAR